MSTVTVSFYNNKSNPKKLDKDLTSLSAYDGNYKLKDRTSVQNPMLLCAFSGDISPDLNYFYIQEFNRYYFVTNVVAVREGLMEVTGRCDVLSSSKARGLGNCSGIVYRSQSGYNLYLDDGYFRCLNKPKIQTHPFSVQLNNFNFVLAIAGSNI